MLLEISTRDGRCIQVPSFSKFQIAYHEFDTLDAKDLSTIRLNKDASYSFIGQNTVVISGNDILYLEVK